MYICSRLKYVEVGSYSIRTVIFQIDVDINNSTFCSKVNTQSIGNSITIRQFVNALYVNVNVCYLLQLYHSYCKEI